MKATALDENQCELLADFFVVFANPIRLRMFCSLQEGRQTVTQLAEHAGISLQNASQHLRMMRDKGAVKTEKEGQRVFYTVADPRFLQAARMIKEALSELMHKKMGTMNRPT